MKIEDMKTPMPFKIKGNNYMSGQRVGQTERECMNLMTGELNLIPYDVEAEPSDFMLTKISTGE